MADIKSPEKSESEASSARKHAKSAARSEPRSAAFTGSASRAFEKGLEEGRRTASRMVYRAEPANVRVRVPAVVKPEPEPQPPAVITAEERQLDTVSQAVEEISLPSAEPESGLTPIVPDGDEKNGISVYMNNNENKLCPADESTPDVTYSMKKGEIIAGTAAVQYSASIRTSPQSQSTSAAASSSVRQEQRSDEKRSFRSRNDDPARPSGGILSVKDKERSASDSSDAPEVVSNKGEKQESGRIVQRWRDISFLRKLIMLAGAVLFVFAFSPLLVGVLTPGIIPIALIGLFFFAAALMWDKIEGCRSRALNLLFTVIGGAVVLGVVVMAFISGKMLGASMNSLPEEKTRVTVVVLGCLVKGDQPSLMLKNRLDTAAEYLLSNPEAYCIVTGGQGEDEDYPEADIMKKYLVGAGISESRILAEASSTSTVENIENAKVLIEKYNCHEDILIVSDRFHQYRARLAAEDAGLNSYALPCETRWELAAQYWFREMVGLFYIWAAGLS